MRPYKQLLAAGVTVLAAGVTTAVAADTRIRNVDYDPDAVIRVDGCPGFQTMVELEQGEHIENIGIGDASKWLVVPNKRADVLFVKPAYPESHSNMMVVTDKRRYNFELVTHDSSTCRRGNGVYSLRLRFPADKLNASREGATPREGAS